MPAARGFTNVQVQVTLVAAVDANNVVLQTWWSFAPDEADMQYTNATPPGTPDQLSWKLTARKIDGSVLPGAAFTPTDGIVVSWPYPQPTRQGDPTVYSMPVTNLNSQTNPDGPYKFIAKVQFNGITLTSPDPQVVLEPAGN